MEKYTIEWGKAGLDKPLSEREKEKLLKQLAGLAKDTNVFHFHVEPKVVNFLKETLTNAYIIKVMGPEDNHGDFWLVIGVDEATAWAEYLKI